MPGRTNMGYKCLVSLFPSTLVSALSAVSDWHEFIWVHSGERKSPPSRLMFQESYPIHYWESLEKPREKRERNQGCFLLNVLPRWPQCSASAQLECNLWDGGEGWINLFLAHLYLCSFISHPSSEVTNITVNQGKIPNSFVFFCLLYTEGIQISSLLIYCIESIWQCVHFQEWLHWHVTNWWPLIDLALDKPIPSRHTGQLLCFLVCLLLAKN